MIRLKGDVLLFLSKPQQFPVLNENLAPGEGRQDAEAFIRSTALPEAPSAGRTDLGMII